MSKLMKRRPSPAMIIAMVALIAALGGGAYAATQKKVEYKGLSKEARLKVLPFSKTASGTDCNPNAAATYTDCATVSVDGSTAFPRKYYVSFNGVFDSVGAPNARGDCRLEADNTPVRWAAELRNAAGGDLGKALEELRKKEGEARQSGNDNLRQTVQQKLENLLPPGTTIVISGLTGRSRVRVRTAIR